MQRQNDDWDWGEQLVDISAEEGLFDLPGEFELCEETETAQTILSSILTIPCTLEFIKLYYISARS